MPKRTHSLERVRLHNKGTLDIQCSFETRTKAPLAVHASLPLVYAIRT